MKLMRSARLFVCLLVAASPIAGAQLAGAQPSTGAAGSTVGVSPPDSSYVVRPEIAPRVAGLAPGMYFGLKTGASTYVGDSDVSAGSAVAPALVGELAYQLTPSLGFGLAYQYAANNHVSSLESDASGDARRMAHLSIRGMLPGERLSPYLQAGVHRLFGSSDEAYGADFGIGIEWKPTQRISIYPEVAFNMVPSGTDGSGRLGGIGSLGLGIRTNLFRRHRAAAVQEIVGPRVVRAGDAPSFRAETIENATQPVRYAWRIDGHVLLGNPVTLPFRSPGRYDVTLETTNRAGVSRSVLTVDVLQSETAVAAAASAAAAAYVPSDGNRPVRIISVYGPSAMRVGENADFRARTAPGAFRPVNYRWDMGDGTLAIGNNITHHYERPGRYVAVVTAQNRKGSDTDSLVITVSEPYAAPAPQPQGESRTDLLTSVDPPEPPAGAETGAGRPNVDVSLHGTSPIDWSKGGFTLHVATTSGREEAEKLARSLRRNGFRSGIYMDDTGRGSAVFRVVVGQFASEGHAVAARQRLLTEGRKGAVTVQRLPARGAGVQ